MMEFVLQQSHAKAPNPTHLVSIRCARVKKSYLTAGTLAEGILPAMLQAVLHKRI